MLKNQAGSNLINDSVNQFMVDREYVYGWIDNSKGGFFVLNTRNGKLLLFPKRDDLDLYTYKQGLSELDMKSSFTFFGIVSGSETPNW